MVDTGTLENLVDILKDASGEVRKGPSPNLMDDIPF